jgi:hypothetical protein
MDKLIESLEIFKKYKIDESYIFFDDNTLNVDEQSDKLEKSDLDRLKILGWGIDAENNTLHFWGVN